MSETTNSNKTNIKPTPSIPTNVPTFSNIPQNQTEFNLNGNSSQLYHTSTQYAEVPPEDRNLQKCWQYGKSVKCFAWLDGFICILNSLVMWPWMFLLIGPLLGYYGAKSYSSSQITGYSVFSGLLLMGRLIILYKIYDGSFEDDSAIMTDTSIFLSWLTMFARAWITWITLKFKSKLDKLDQQELSTLQIGTYVPICTQVLYY